MDNKYLVDTNVFRAIENYYPSKFKTIWININQLVSSGRFLSVREVKREIDGSGWQEFMKDFFTKNQNIFTTPCERQLTTVRGIMGTNYGRQLVRKKQWNGGLPVADPFLIAAAAVVKGGIVVTREEKREGAKIPHICSVHKVKCMNLEEMMDAEGWSF
jgi:hypothetical protein